jgi:RNA polymerase sigma factor (sigma-70 family)
LLDAEPAPTDLDDRSLMARYVARYCPAWLREQQEDLVQMALVRVLRAGSTVEHRHAYFKRTAKATLMDEMRRARHRSEVAMSTSIRRRATNSMDLSPETRVRGGQVGAAVQEAIGEVVASRQSAVRLYLEGHGVGEIARRLDQPRKTTANQVYRGLEDLREALRLRGVEP